LKETQQDIDIIKAEHLEEIRQLVNKHAEEIKYYTKEKTLNETLESLGYKIEKGMFGTKLTKIK
jgi:N-acetyl-anhydromuramyl-L-alanine amidase AmpD